MIGCLLNRGFVSAAALTSLALVGCEKGNASKESGSNGAATTPAPTYGQSGLHLTVELLDTEGISSVRTDVTRVACAADDPAAEFEAHTQSVTAPILDIPFGGAEAGIEGVGFEGHAFADAFFVLPAGCYDVTSTLLDSAGAAIAECSQASASSLEVRDGETTDAWIVSQCEGPEVGALDVTTIVNRPPVIEGLTFSPSKYTACEPVTICVTASDPDGDALEFEWSQNAGGDLGDLGPDANNASGDNQECVTVDPSANGAHSLTVTVYDLISYGGATVRIEEYLAAHGEAHESRDDLTFPLYVSQCEEGETDSNEPPVDGGEEPCPCSDGDDGDDHSDATDATDATDAADGADATDATDAADATDAVDAADATDAVDATDATDAVDAADATDAVDAADAMDATDAVDAADATDAVDAGL